MNIREIRKAKISDLGILIDTPIVTENADKKQILEKIALEPHFLIVTSGPGSKVVKGVITLSDVDKGGDNVKASAMMSGDVITADANQTVDEVTMKMKENNISALPVLNENNEFIGLVTGPKLRQKIASDVQLTY